MVRTKNYAGAVADEAKAAVTVDPYHICKRCARKRQETSKYLPQDIIFQCLLLLPAHFLVDVVRHVCKEWSLIIHSPNFAHHHLRNSTGGVLIQTDYGSRMGFYLELRQGCIKLHEFDWGLNNLVRTSCNGLVVMSSRGRGRHYLCRGQIVNYVINPLTKQLTVLPPLSKHQHYKDCGLAFVESSMVYKVIRACGYNSLVPKTQIAVLTIGVDKAWRHIDMTHLLPSSEELQWLPEAMHTG